MEQCLTNPSRDPFIEESSRWISFGGSQPDSIVPILLTEIRGVGWAQAIIPLLLLNFHEATPTVSPFHTAPNYIASTARRAAHYTPDRICHLAEYTGESPKGRSEKIRQNIEKRRRSRAGTLDNAIDPVHHTLKRFEHRGDELLEAIRRLHSNSTLLGDRFRFLIQEFADLFGSKFQNILERQQGIAEAGSSEEFPDSVYPVGQAKTNVSQNTADLLSDARSSNP